MERVTIVKPISCTQKNVAVPCAAVRELRVCLLDWCGFPLRNAAVTVPSHPPLQVGELAFTQGEKAFYEEVLRDGHEARRALTEHEVAPDDARLAAEAETGAANGDKPRRACLALVCVNHGMMCSFTL